jgi:predicted nucleotidyltransferase
MNAFLSRYPDWVTLILLWVRRMVLATSVPPLLSLYRACYGGLIRRALRLFGRYPGIKAVYLRRGCAKGEDLPGVSDIDFAVITEEGALSEGERQELNRAYAKLARFTAVLDPSLEICDEAEIQRQYAADDAARYRFTEGKRTWRLLSGRDCLQDLPESAAGDLDGGCYAEAKIWWSLFSQRSFHGTAANLDIVNRNTICYKAVSEAVKMELALHHGELTFLRSEALQRGKGFLGGEERALVERLEKVARQRFLRREDGLHEESMRFLLRGLDRCCGRLPERPFARGLEGYRIRVDCDPAECFAGAAESDAAWELARHAQREWPESYCGAHLVPSSFFSLDELLLMIKLDPDRLPTPAQIADLYRRHQELQARPRRRMSVFLLLNNAAYQVDARHLHQCWQAILCPPCNPEVFALLGRHGFALDVPAARPSVAPVWTQFAQRFYAAEQELFVRLLDDPALYKLNSLDFLRTFWTTVQLLLINRSARSRKVLYALTLPALERGLAQEGMPLPAPLGVLADAYRDEVAGRESEIETLVPAAIRYLKEIAA